MPSRFSHGLIAGVLLAALAGGVAAREAMVFTPSQKAHWAWKRPTRPPLPRVRLKAWVRNPIDAFVLARLEAKGLRPAPAASREELIRRVAFDLTGLPPTPEEIDAFLADRSPNAWDKVVDRYLASPAYGERWARHWLDVARYADSNGYEFDEIRPDSWRYRDYVVRSLNADKPYNRFIMEQLAGDEIAPEDPDALIATGFNLLGPDMTDAADQAARRQNTLNDMTDTASLAFLGMTLGCARCHDHKYEPIPQADYYRLQAFFVGAQFRKDLPVGTPEELRRFAEAEAAWMRELERLRTDRDSLAGSVRETLRAAKIARLPEDLQTAFALPERDRMPDQQKLVEANEPKVEPTPKEVAEKLPPEARRRYEQLVDQIKKVEARRPARPTAMGLSERGPAPKTFVLGRGELANRESEVSPGFPIILTAAAPAVQPTAASSGRRTALARWIASPDNPLTARVMVNRVWQHHFGRGIVPTPSDFGVRGESATHPELLDWLASVFAASRESVEARKYGSKEEGKTSSTLPHLHTSTPGLNWSLKALHRLILTSNAYKQSSRASPQALAADPENELFSRMNRKRLEAEAIRDAALAVSGRLNRKSGGPGVFPPIPPEARPSPAAWPVAADPAEHTRRTLYIFVRRNLNFPEVEAFDSPDTNSSCARREVTTSAPQALTLLNGTEMQANAAALATRTIKAPGTAARVELAYRLTLGRKPNPQELNVALEFLQRQQDLLGRAGNQRPEEAAWTDYCLALLNLNEFVYVD